MKTAVYKCDDYFSFSSETDNKLNCNGDGQWTGNLGKCNPGKIH